MAEKEPKYRIIIRARGVYKYPDFYSLAQILSIANKTITVKRKNKEKNK